MSRRIVTRYSGATDTRGSRIIVQLRINGKRKVQRTYSYDYAAYCAHHWAAEKFASEFGITLPNRDNRGYNETGYIYTV